MNTIYSLLTWMICVLSNLRGKLCGDEHELRWDRTLSWSDPELDAEQGVLYMSCCDCGLTHFLVLGKSATPERPKRYTYRFRARHGPVEAPDPELGECARIRFLEWCEAYA